MGWGENIVGDDQMLSFLKPRYKDPVPAEKQQALFQRYKWMSLFGVFIGYAAFYIVRNNFTLSTPQLKS